MKNRIIKLVLGVITGVMMFGMTAFAAEGVTVADTNAVLYTASGADLLMDADSNAAVALADLQAGLPIQVTGITSNGFFRIALNGQTFYVEGTGLVQTAGTATAATTASTVKNADGTVPVKDANGNYVCVIEDTDFEVYQRITGFTSGMPLRIDYTQHPIYIYLRDEIESEIAAGKEETFAEWYGLSLNEEAKRIARNVMIDVYKSHPQYQDAATGVNGFTGNYGMDNPFNGQSEANYWVGINKADISRAQMVQESYEDLLRDATAEGFIVRRR